VASAEVRVGPGRGENEELGETDSNRLRNQSLFLRTLNVTLSENVWKEMFPHLVPVADQNHHHSGVQKQHTCSAPHATNTGHSSDPQQSRSHSSQNQPPSRSRNSTNILSSDLMPPILMSPFGSFNSRPSTDSFTDMFLQDLENTSKMKCVAIDEEIKCDSTPTSDVTLTRSSSCNVSVTGTVGIALHHASCLTILVDRFASIQIDQPVLAKTGMYSLLMCFILYIFFKII
jgi:hypothetical protein